MADIEFHFDFGSPNAYLAHRVIPSAGAPFRYVPVLLGGVFKATNNRSPMEAFPPAKLAYAQVETKRFLAKHGIADFVRNPFFPVNTLAIMRGAVAAGREGCFARYADVVFRAMWVEARKMDDPAVIQAVLTENGLDAGLLMTRTGDAGVKAELIANTEASVARGNFGSPTFFVGDQMFFGKDQLRDALEEYQRR
jgi:2-hydroxychromene-2-carboxylate isomerase